MKRAATAVRALGIVDQLRLIFGDGKANVGFAKVDSDETLLHCDLTTLCLELSVRVDNSNDLFGEGLVDKEA